MKKICREERRAYSSRASHAHHHPHQLFSVAIDGMDTTKTLNCRSQELAMEHRKRGILGFTWFGC